MLCRAYQNLYPQKTAVITLAAQSPVLLVLAIEHIWCALLSRVREYIIHNVCEID